MSQFPYEKLDWGYIMANVDNGHDDITKEEIDEARTARYGVAL